MESFIKYLGGKRKEIHLFEELIPDEFDRYVEPCVGGGSLFFYLERKNSWINDINIDLINLYTDIKNKGYKIQSQLQTLSKLYNQLDMVGKSTLFYTIRKMFNNEIPSKYERSTMYVFLNKTSFSGLYRVNSKGLYNTPFGKYDGISENIITDEHVILLESAEITNVSYDQVFNKTKVGDFVFIDPPYDTIFTEYGNGEQWGEDRHREFARDFKNLSCKAMIVINRTELTAELYKDYIKASYDKSYVVNCVNRINDHGTEHIVVCNY